MVYNASVIEAHRSFSDKFYFVKQQAIWVSIGLILMVGLSFIPHSLFKKFGVWGYFISILMLTVVLIPAIGTKVLGARRWLTIGSFRLQPAEITKLTLIIYLASFLEKKQKFLQFLLIMIITGGLIAFEPDLGTTVVVMGIAMSMYFLSGAPLKKLLILIIGGVLAALAFIMSSDYRRARVATFFNPTHDPLGASYHIRQILIALGSGGLYGLGIGKSRQKYEYIPAATTDSIFAIIAEEIGFIGSVIVILIFTYLIIRAFKIARNAPNQFTQLLASGITAWIALQTMLNLATMVALVPLTGVPLPFISYGGSSTITNLAAIGMLLNISRYGKK
jgi:cell division protein FtsW